jgi:hypothetical protein
MTTIPGNISYEGYLFYPTDGIIVSYDIAYGTDIVIPSTISGYDVKSIGKFAFREKGLTSVVIPDSIVEISLWAFYDNELINIVIPESVTNISTWAFLSNPIVTVTVLGDKTRFNDEWDRIGFPSELKPE